MLIDTKDPDVKLHIGHSHIYIYKSDTPLRSVSSITKMWPHTEGLTRWWINTFKTYDDMIADLHKSSDRGTRVHKCCEAIAGKKEPEPEDDIKGYVKAYKKFYDEKITSIWATEQVVYNLDRKIGGTYDQGITDDGGRVAIIDIKTTKSKLSRRDVWFSKFIQCNEYAKIASVPYAGILRLGEDGEYEYKFWQTSDDLHDLFEHLRAIAESFREVRLPKST
jgi:hypothetical protein